jgi:hypothetical protein
MFTLLDEESLVSVLLLQIDMEECHTGISDSGQFQHVAVFREENIMTLTAESSEHVNAL